MHITVPKVQQLAIPPYYLLFGRHPRLPIDVLLPSQSNHTSSYPEYAKKWEDQMRQAYQIAKIHSQERRKISIDIYKGKVIGHTKTRG